MADAHGSGPCEVTLMWVQLPSSAGKKRLGIRGYLVLSLF